jgi:sterol desaturase/sphingolipid hydroxylase (fatty acid hydroxylase superfamily)
MTLEERLRSWFGDDDPKRLGSGWTSGVLAVFLGAAGLLAVVCFHFPALLTMPELRAVYPMAGVRAAVEIVIGVAFLLGVVSLGLRRRKALGATGVVLALAAGLLGGGAVPVSGPVANAPHLGLDWFLLNILMLCAVFIPLEKLAPLHRRGFFRRGWATDGLYFLFGHLLVQVTTLLTLAPATVLFAPAKTAALERWVAAQPAALQFLEIVLVADLAEYAIHRLFHRLRPLWPFHEVHHSSREMDWLAGSRLHLVDVVATRGFTFLPIYLLGFERGPVVAYLAFVSIHAVFIHANVRWRFGALEQWIVTPHFHHWHHAAERAAVDKNFAVHFPWIDRLFGTWFAPPNRWPADYGVAPVPADDRVPDGYAAQWLYPFRRAGREAERERGGS